MPPKAKQNQTSPSETPGLPDSSWTYEAAVEQVEAIIAQLETGDLPLEAVFNQFGQAVVSLQQCEAYLSTKQEQVELLIETLEK